MYSNSIASYQRYLCSGKQTGFLPGLAFLRPLLFVAELAIGAISVNSSRCIVVEFNDRPRRALIVFSVCIDLVLGIFGVGASETHVSFVHGTWFVAGDDRKFLRIECLETDDGALSSIHETSVRLQVGLKHYAHAFF